MRYTPLLLIAVLSLVSFYGCSKDATDPSGNLYSIEGTVVDSRGPVIGATVSIDGAYNWTTSTSTSGYFKIQEVSEGNHTLFVEHGSDDANFVERSVALAVYNDIILEALRLPSPVVMEEPQDVTMSSISLRWHSTDAEDFVEYKLYRRETPGLDETTGELVYVATARDDTSFTDTGLIAMQTYYYRVYIMNQYGRLGGSNIVNAQTLAGNLVPDGDFEDPNCLADHWLVVRIPSGTEGFQTFLDSTDKKEGRYSLYNINPRAFNRATELVLKQPLALVPNMTYVLSCWLKANGLYLDVGDPRVTISQNDNHIADLFFMTPVVDKDPNADWASWTDSTHMDWTFKSTTFYVTKTDPILVTLYFPIEEVWVDDLTIMRE